MQQFEGNKSEPACLVRHNLLNKLSVIVGYCELLEEQVPPGSRPSKHVSAIQSIAKSIAEELNRHQCQFDAVMQVLPAGGGAERLDPEAFRKY